jgi:hypothetical protein
MQTKNKTDASIFSMKLKLPSGTCGRGDFEEESMTKNPNLSDTTAQINQHQNKP